MKLILILACLVSFAIPVFAQELPPPPIIIVKPLTISELIHVYAVKYYVSEVTMNRVIKCESGYHERAVGDGGTSFGLVQIHLPAHPTVTKLQAFDKEFAIEFLAKNLALGKGRMWSCF